MTQDEAIDQAEALVDALELLRAVVTTCDDNWRKHECNALMRAVLLGFDDYDPERDEVLEVDGLVLALKRSHGWTDAKIDHLRRLHNAIALITGDPSRPSTCDPARWVTGTKGRA